MHAYIEGALNQIDKSWRFFEHKGIPMRKDDVIKVLKYALEKGYKFTSEIKDEEVDEILKS